MKTGLCFRHKLCEFTLRYASVSNFKLICDLLSGVLNFFLQDGSPNLGKLSDLAIELAAKLGFDSLEMYAVLQQEWSNANEAFIGKKNKVHS